MKVCRTCLQVLSNDAKCLSMDTNDCSMEFPSIQKKLLACVPEMAMDIQQAFICMPCSDALNTAYDFKNKCLQTETTITNYAQYLGCNRDSISISEVVSFNGTDMNGEIHYPITEIIEDRDSDVDIKPVINNEFSEPLIYSSENTEVGIGVKPENPDYDGHVNSDNMYSLPKNVVFGPELDVEVRAFNHENIADPFGEIADCNQVNHFMEIGEESTLGIKTECPYCQKSFSNVSELDAHVTSHMENRPLKCTLCERRFVRKDKLQLHMRTHTGEKPFECVTCGRCFSRKDKLNNHIRTHTGEKPHQCILCQKSFARKDKMNMHMKSQHWLVLANLEITVVKKEGLVNNSSETNTSESSST